MLHYAATYIRAHTSYLVRCVCATLTLIDKKKMLTKSMYLGLTRERKREAQASIIYDRPTGGLEAESSISSMFLTAVCTLAQCVGLLLFSALVVARALICKHMDLFVMLVATHTHTL